MSGAPTPEEKPWWQSKTIIGSAIAVVATIAGFFNVTVDPEMQSTMVEAVSTIGAVIGSVIAIIGRLTAKKTLS